MTDSLPDRPALARRGAPALCAAALLAAALAGPADARAASAAASGDVEGQATLTVGKRVAAARALRAAGVRISRIAPARARGGSLTFAPERVQVRSSSAGAVELAGGLRFRAGRRSVAVTGLRVGLGRRKGTVTGRLAGRRVTLLTFATGSARLALLAGPADVALSSTYATLTRSGARALARRLGRRGVKAGRLGTLALDAAADAGPPPAAKAGEPPVLARPSGAVTARDVAITWSVRESFINYLNGFGGSVSASGGAKKGKARGEARLVYDYRFRPYAGRSWHDRASDTTALYGRGTVRFRLAAHGIDLSVSDPEVELNGADSRVIFTVRERGGEARREVVMKLALVPKARGRGGSVTYEMLPGSIPEGEATSLFAGFYQPGAEFGSMTVTFRPEG